MPNAVLNGPVMVLDSCLQLCGCTIAYEVAPQNTLVLGDSRFVLCGSRWSFWDFPAGTSERDQSGIPSVCLSCSRGCPRFWMVSDGSNWLFEEVIGLFEVVLGQAHPSMLVAH